MGLGSHALALGIGYVLGHPQGRERARQVPAQVRELANRPETARLVEKGKSFSGQAVQTAKQRLNRSGGSGSGTSTTGTAGTGTSDTLTTGDTGRLVTDEGARPRRRFLVRPRRRPGGIDTPTSGDPKTDVRAAVANDAPVSEETETAMQGTLPPGARGGPS
jgi:hypothetical protein